MENLFKSLAAFQQEVPAICENTKGYGYTYSDLKTIIFHTESGEHIETTCSMPQGVELKGMNAFQVAGSAITYYRRYSLSAALGLVTDVDSDAKGEEVKPVVKPTLTDERFKKALEVVKTGEYYPADLKNKYELSESQLKQLNDLL